LRLLPDPLHQARIAGGDRLGFPVDPGLDAVPPMVLLSDGQIGHEMVPPRVMNVWPTRTDGTWSRSDTRGRLQGLDEPGRLREREVLGPPDAVIAQQPVEVGVLPGRDRADRTHLVLGGGPPWSGSPGRWMLRVTVAGGLAVRRMAGRRVRRVVRRHDG